MSGDPAGRASRDSAEVEALITDRYLEALLSAHARGADSAPTVAGTDPVVRLTAARMHLQLAAGGEGVMLPLSPPGPSPQPLPVDDDAFGIHADARLAVRRPLLIGGALTSAAISLAGAAYVAWRIRHAQASPMARAVRAVARARLS